MTDITLWEADEDKEWLLAILELEQAHRTELDEDTRLVYLKHLSILSLEQFKGVVEISPQLSRGFPSIHDILELGGLELPQVLTQREGEAAWRELRQGKKNLGELTLSNIALKIVMEMGGRGNGPNAFGRWAPDESSILTQVKV